LCGLKREFVFVTTTAQRLARGAPTDAVNQPGPRRDISLEVLDQFDDDDAAKIINPGARGQLGIRPGPDSSFELISGGQFGVRCDSPVSPASGSQEPGDPPPRSVR